MSIGEVFAVAEGGGIVAENGGGTVVPWWSFTKTAIAAAALTLVRDGELDLDARLASKPFTLRQLLQHRAGVAEYGALSEYHRAVADRAEPWSVVDLLRRADANRLRFSPGSDFLYSNIGYLFVRQLMEETVGATLECILRERLFQPLGVKHASIAETPADLVGVEMSTAGDYHPRWVYHGLLVGPLGEAALLLERLLGGSLLPPELIEQMLNGRRVGAHVPQRPWKKPAYGLGLMCGEIPQNAFIAGHTGGGPGSVIAVYRLYDRQPIRTGAAFMPGADAGAVERAAIQHAAGTK
jgi:CubicO group peptidase (beta-lactamase class C family)